MSTPTLIGYSIPDFVYPGVPFTPTVTYRNDGPDTWIGSVGYGVSSMDPTDNQRWGWNRCYLPAGSYPTGSQVTIPLPSLAPAPSPGSPYQQYNYAFQFVLDSVGRFGPLIDVDLIVLPPQMANPSSFNRPGPDQGGVRIFDSGPFLGYNRHRKFSWPNPAGRPLKVCRAALWIGLDAATLDCDACIDLLRSDGSHMASFYWDHYQQPTMQAVQNYYFSPSFVLGANEQLIVDSYINVQNPNNQTHAEVIVWVYFEM